jgi:Plasmid stabilization system protein
MKYRIEFLPIAELELEDVLDWYESKQMNLGAEFLLTFDTILNYITDNPYLFPIVHNDMRKAPLPTFPYSFIYEVHDPEVILVLAVIHQKQNPTRWMSR